MSAPYKIWFHKQASEVLYADLTKETLAHKKSRQKIEKLEAQLKQEKLENKAWTTQVAQLQTEIVMLKEQAPSEDRPVKKIKTLRRRGQVVDADTSPSPQLVQLHEEINALKVENIETNAKFLSLEKEKTAWDSKKERLLRKIEELNEREFADPKSPTYQLIKDISNISLK